MLPQSMKQFARSTRFYIPVTPDHRMAKNPRVSQKMNSKCAKVIATYTQVAIGAFRSYLARKIFVLRQFEKNGNSLLIVKVFNEFFYTHRTLKDN